MFFLVEYFHVGNPRTGPAHGEGERERQRANERETERAGERRQCFFLFSLPAVNLVGFSVTFIREGDLVHLKRQMKELEANYQEIEKR